MEEILNIAEKKAKDIKKKNRKYFSVSNFYIGEKNFMKFIVEFNVNGDIYDIDIIEGKPSMVNDERGEVIELIPNLNKIEEDFLLDKINIVENDDMKTFRFVMDSIIEKMKRGE